MVLLTALALPIITAAVVLAPARSGIVATATSAKRPPCGLSKRGFNPRFFQYYAYRIRNCQRRTIRRKVAVSGYIDGDCHTIRSGRTVKGSTIVPIYGSVQGLRRC